MEVTSKIIFAFVSVVLGIMLLAATATMEQSTTSVTNTSKVIDITNARLAGLIGINASYVLDVGNGLGTWRQTYSECIPTHIHFYNQSGTELTSVTNYVYTWNVNSGSLTLVNAPALNSSAVNTTSVSMDYCADGYAGGWTASVLDISLGMLGIAILGIGIGLFYSVGKETGIL